MRLRIITPLAVVVDTQIASLRAEDASGGFGVLPGHAPFLTALATSILSWRAPTEGAVNSVEHFCALRGGVMTVVQTCIDVATLEAVVGDDLATLDAEVLAQFQADADSERTEHVEAVSLHLSAIRRMVSRLKPSATGGGLR